MKILISDYDRYEFETGEAAMIIAGGYVAIFAVVLLFYHSFFLAAAAGPAAIFILGPVRRMKAQRRMTLLVTQFRDLLYSLSSSVAAGRQMDAALAEAYESLSMVYAPDTPMMVELSAMLKGIFENHESEEALLSDLAERTHQEDIAGFADVYRASRRTGADLGRVIENTSKVIMEKIAIEREIEAVTKQKIFEGKMITAMPLLVVLFLNIFSPDYLAVMYETFQGRIVMTLALAGIAAGWRLTGKILDLKV